MLPAVNQPWTRRWTKEHDRSCINGFNAIQWLSAYNKKRFLGAVNVS